MQVPWPFAQYTRGMVLFQTNLGRVQRVQHISQGNLIVKVSNITQTQRENPVLEENLLRTLAAHDTENLFFPRLHHAERVTDAAGQTWHYMFIQDCGHDLHTLVSSRGRFSEDCARAIFSSILAAVEALHQAGYAHLDLKPENILYGADGYFRVCDFGQAQASRFVQSVAGPFGTPAYCSPEQHRANNFDTRRADMFSLGVILFVLLTRTEPDTVSHAIRDETLFTQNDNFSYLSSEARDLIKRLVCGVDKRLSLDQALDHPWLNPLA